MQTGSRTFDDPRAGIRATVRRTGSETGGAAVVVELLMQPHRRRPRLHRHPRQQERVEVLTGSVVVQLGRRHELLGPGSRVTVPPGVAHRLWPAGDEPAQVVAELSPALGFEAYLEQSFAAAGLLRSLRVLLRHRDTVRPALFPP